MRGRRREHVRCETPGRVIYLGITRSAGASPGGGAKSQKSPPGLLSRQHLRPSALPFLSLSTIHGRRSTVDGAWLLVVGCCLLTTCSMGNRCGCIATTRRIDLSVTSVNEDSKAVTYNAIGAQMSQSCLGPVRRSTDTDTEERSRNLADRQVHRIRNEQANCHAACFFCCLHLLQTKKGHLERMAFIVVKSKH